MMEKYILSSVFIKNLKGLKEINVNFFENSIAVIGVNGSGKTTVIHALACLYQPDGKGENYRFPAFFVPNTDSLWTCSELSVVNEKINSSGERTILSSRTYRKAYGRWNLRYTSRLKRNVYYIVIDSCLPEIEKKTSNSWINYTTTELTDKQAINALLPTWRNHQVHVKAISCRFKVTAQQPPHHPKVTVK